MAAAIVATFVFVFGSHLPGAFVGGWTLITLVIVLGFLGGVLTWFRDADPSAGSVEVSSAADVEGISAAGPAIPPSLWPMVAAAGAVLTAVGLAYERRMFVFGVLIMAVALIEWMVLAWADRYSMDAHANAVVRAKMMRPFEFPVFGLLIGAFMVLSFSRVVLALNEKAALVVFAAAAALVFATAIALSFRPDMKRLVVASALTVGAVAVFAGGIAGATIGERKFDEDVECTKTAGPNSVGAKSSLLAEITVDEAGARLGDTKLDSPILVPNSAAISLRFINKTGVDEEFLITSSDGKVVRDESCPVGNDQSALLTLRFKRPGDFNFGTKETPNLGMLNVR
jgi:hypothetical protein